MKLLLVGFQGVGKSFFGKKLAQKLKMPFFDTDRLVEILYTKKSQSQLAVSKIFQREGEGVFKALEKQVISSLIKEKEGIIASGGGLPLRCSSTLLLPHFSPIVYLKKNPALLFSNLVQKMEKEKQYPHYMAKGDKDSFNAAYNKRVLAYQKLSSHTLDISSLSEGEVMEEILHIVTRIRDGK